MKISKLQITDAIYEKLDKAIPKLVIYDVITIVSEYIESELKKDRIVSIDNFGTFSTHLFHEHEGLDISTGKMQKVESFRSIKFHAHENFRKLLTRKREKFQKKKKNRRSS